MIIECPKCHSKYEVDEAYIPIGGAPVQCPKCGNIFGIYVMPIDIPMTPIMDAEPPKPEPAPQPEPQPAPQPAPAPQPEPKPEPAPQPAPEPVQQPAPQPEPAQQEADLGALGFGAAQPEPAQQADDLSAFGTIPDQASETPDIGANPEPQQTHDFSSYDDMPDSSGDELGGLGFGAPQAPAAEPSPDLGSMMDNAQPEPEPEAAPSPDLGALGFGAAQPEPEPDAGVSPDLGSMMDQVSEPEPAPEAAPSPDLGALGFGAAQPEPQPAPQPEPAPQPAPQPEPEQSDAAKKVGGLFESLLAGFSLPDNFKNLPPNVQKNHKDAIKLARQLAKDILLYHKDDVERGMANGNVKDVLKDEVEKSYKFYTQRVQPELLETTNYFNEALNKIVAKGQNVY